MTGWQCGAVLGQVTTVVWDHSDTKRDGHVGPFRKTKDGWLEPSNRIPRWWDGAILGQVKTVVCDHSVTRQDGRV